MTGPASVNRLTVPGAVRPIVQRDGWPWTIPPQPDVAVVDEQVLGLGHIKDRFAALVRIAHREIMGVLPGSSPTGQDAAGFWQLDAQLLDRLSVRCVCPPSIGSDPATAAVADRLSALGAQVRAVPAPPTWMIIIDRAAALVPISGGAPAAALLLTSEGSVAALGDLFDMAWAAAEPIQPAQRDEHNLTSQQVAILRFLAAGFTDEAIARRLGISHRSARRAAADLLARLGARGRFQAGVRAVQYGWLTANGKAMAEKLPGRG